MVVPPQEETGVKGKPVKVLGVWNTFFPTSAWGEDSHTINIAVHVITDEEGEGHFINVYVVLGVFQGGDDLSVLLHLKSQISSSTLPPRTTDGSLPKN